jgi:thiamine biosynthesis lipoprotein
MACPCEILIRTDSITDAEELGQLAHTEALRIEHKFSRYRDDNIVYAINKSGGNPVKLDEETLKLLEYAGHCHSLSEGLFDITSGILRRAWTFKGEKLKPNQKLIESLLELVGWEKIKFSRNEIVLLPGMEIDFGGIGKEYAVDKTAQLLFSSSGLPAMINFGGDITIVGSEKLKEPWCVGISDPEQPDFPVGFIEMLKGAVTTSGVSYRHCFVNGKRLGHIINPKTGWPAADAPRSVTVVGNFCMEAGMLSTLAMLYGKDAETFLIRQNVKFHCIW